MLPCHIDPSTGNCDYAKGPGRTVVKGGTWNLSSRYYMKLSQKKPDKPQVVLFTVIDNAALTPTTPNFQVTGDGSVDFAWAPVAGATSYTLYRISRDGMRPPVFSVIGDTAGTRLNTGVESGERDYVDGQAPVGGSGADLAMQSELLGGQLVDQTQDDLLALGGATAGYDPAQHGLPQMTFAVQAHGAGGATSPLVEVAGDALSAQVPLRPALTAAALRQAAQPCAYADCLSVWQTVPVTMMDGRTVERPVSFASAPARTCAGPDTVGLQPCLEIDAQVVGTMFHRAFYFQGTTWSAADQAAVDRQTALNARTTPPASSGAPLFAHPSAVTVPPAGAVSTPPPLDSPITGTTPLVRYIGANLTAGNCTMDVTDYLSAGVTLDDALGEAIAQNPQTLMASQVTAAVSVSGGRTTVQVTWTGTDAATMAQRREQTVTKAAQVIAAIVRPNMSDREKAQAINDWIVANTSYDYSARQTVRGTSGDPDGMRRASGYPGFADASGVLLDGSADSLGFAEAFKLLADDAGLTAVVVTGVATASGEPHAWNKVRFGNQWRVVDVAWNADGPNYFGLTDAQANQTRTEDAAWVSPGLQSAFAA